MRKLILNITFFVICISHLATFAQDTIQTRKQSPEENPLDKVFFGGSFAAQFDVYTFIDVSPIVGYWLTEKVAAGVGLSYQYHHYNDGYYDFTNNVYGGRIFGKYFLTQKLFAHIEYEYLNVEAFDLIPSRRVDVTGLLVGGGYVQRIGENAGLMAMILYNTTYSYYTPYQNPIIRIGFILGI